MTHPLRLDGCEVGYDVPAAIGMDEADVHTPCLILDLDALEHNVRRMGDIVSTYGVRHRAHAKMHKSVDVALLQQSLGGACGVCCQKVSEAETFARGGIEDILITNEIRGSSKVDRLARLPKLGARIITCVDDIENVRELSEAAVAHGTEIECLVEIDCGAHRGGVSSAADALSLAKAISAAPNLKHSGIQSYQGKAQHIQSFADRKAAAGMAIQFTRGVVAELKAAGLSCEIVGGGGTGTFEFEGASGIYNEIQCGSYAFMDAHYASVLKEDGKGIGEDGWRHALFVLTTVMSTSVSGKPVCDAGLKSHSVDSGLPTVWERDDILYMGPSDEHGVLSDPHHTLRVGDRLKLVPGHCDPTCNLHDWYVGLRDGKVEVIWPVSARGRLF